MRKNKWEIMREIVSSVRIVNPCIGTENLSEHHALGGIVLRSQRMKCNKDCLNCNLPVCKHDLESGRTNRIIRGNIVGFGDRLEEILKKRRMKQSELADKTRISRPTICAYVNGLRIPRAEHVVVICEVLNCSSDWLLGLES